MLLDFVKYLYYNTSASFFQKNKRNIGVSVGGNRVSSRTSDSTGGAPFSSDSIVGTNGLSISAEGRSKNERKWQRAKSESARIAFEYPLTTFYIISLIIFGLVWQIEI